MSEIDKLRNERHRLRVSSDQPKYAHLCESCVHEFATCNGEPTFLEDVEPEWKHTKYADLVFDCKQYRGYND